MRLPVIQYGDPKLTQKANLVHSFDDVLEANVNNIVDTLIAENALGLAAQHLGINQKIIAVNLRLSDAPDLHYSLDGNSPPLAVIMPLVLINPELEVIPGDTALFQEGSVSFPGIRADVERPVSINVSFQDLKGTPHKLSCNGLLSRVIQHEFDHLENVLFIERMAPRVLGKLLPKLKKLKRHTKASLKKT